jgi:hypothetical protein
MVIFVLELTEQAELGTSGERTVNIEKERSCKAEEEILFSRA